jgi:hypothetical protein
LVVLNTVNCSFVSGNHDDIVYLLSCKGADVTPHLVENFPDIFKNLVQRYIIPYEADATPVDMENPLKVG